MPLSPERMEELRQLHAASKAVAKPVVLSNEPDWLTQLAPDAPAAQPSGLTPERMDELRQLHAAQKGAQPKPEQKNSDFWHNLVPNEKGYDYQKYNVGGMGLMPAKYNQRTGMPELTVPPLVRSITQGIGDLYQGAETAAATKGGDTPPITPDALGVVGGIAMMNPTFTRAPKQGTPNPLIPDDARIITDQSSGGISGAERLANKVAKNEIKANKPVELYKDMLGNYKQIESVNNSNFDNLSAISSKTEAVDVKPLQAGVKSIIKEIEDSPASPERANLTFFKRVNQTIDKGEKLPISDVVDLNKFLNSRYNPKKVGTAEKLSETQLHSQVKGILENYGTKNPEWGATYKQAQGFFQNEVAPLKSDFVTKKGFDVNDAKIIERFNRGELKQLPDELIERARALPSKITDDVAYNRLAPLVSPEKQAQFGKLVQEQTTPAGSKSGNIVSRLGRTAAYGVGSLASGGSPYMRARFGAEVAGMIKGQDPLYPLIKRGVQPIGERIAPDMQKAQALAQMIAKTPPAGQKALPYYPKGFSPAETPAKYVESLAAKRSQELAPSQLGQERAAFEAAQAKSADMARMIEQQKVMEAESALASRQAGVSPEQYAKFLEQQTPPIVAQAPVATPPNVLYNPQQMAQKALNEARGSGKPMNNPAFTNEDIVNELIKLRLYGKRK